MSMGIVSDNSFEAELAQLENHGDNQRLSDIIPMPQKGRQENSVAVPEVLQKIIGDSVIEEGRSATKSITKFLGISDSSLSAYTKGATSTSSYHEPKLELINHLNKTKDKIITKSRSRLLRALNHITDEKLSVESARNLAGVAKDMSAVIKNLEPEIPLGNNENNGVQFVIYAPQIRHEDSFDIIHANE